MVDFQRARSAEQREARRATILATAAAMLAEMPVAELSLNELSRRVGLAKSNVLRYFESREAVLLELLDSTAQEWLDDAAGALAVATDTPVDQRVREVGATLARTAAVRPLLCELVAASGAVLERNISADVARQYKLSMMANAGRLAGSVGAALPEIAPGGLEAFTAGLFVIVAGLWPLTCPTEAMQVVYQDERFAAYRIEFEPALAELLSTLLAGSVVRQAAGRL